MVSEEGVGPIHAGAQASPESMQSLLPGYQAKAGYAPGLGPDNNLGLPPDVHVSTAGDLLFIVMPDEHGQVSEVRVMSARVGSQMGWQVGDKLIDVARIAGCECIADGLTCFARDSHVGVVLDIDCSDEMWKDASAGRDTASVKYRRLRDGDRTAVAALGGQTIRLLRWRAERFDSSEKPAAAE